MLKFLNKIKFLFSIPAFFCLYLFGDSLVSYITTIIAFFAMVPLVWFLSKLLQEKFFSSDSKLGEFLHHSFRSAFWILSIMITLKFTTETTFKNWVYVVTFCFLGGVLMAFGFLSLRFLGIQNEKDNLPRHKLTINYLLLGGLFGCVNGFIFKLSIFSDSIIDFRMFLLVILFCACYGFMYGFFLSKVGGLSLHPEISRTNTQKKYLIQGVQVSLEWLFLSVIYSVIFVQFRFTSNFLFAFIILGICGIIFGLTEKQRNNLWLENFFKKYNLINYDSKDSKHIFLTTPYIFLGCSIPWSLIIVYTLSINVQLKYESRSENINPGKKMINAAKENMPIIYFDHNDIFYPVYFNTGKTLNWESHDTLVSVPIDSINLPIRGVKTPEQFFNRIGHNSNKDDVFYISSLGIIPENWERERMVDTFPEKIPVYLNFNENGDRLKITYTIPYEGNMWKNCHRGDGALFAIYFIKNSIEEYKPVKIRAYNHYMFTESNFLDYQIPFNGVDKNSIFVVNGSHSTYLKPGIYNNCDPLPFLKYKEESFGNFCIHDDFDFRYLGNIEPSTIEYWAFRGDIYWGGSPNDRIFFKEKIFKQKWFPLANKSNKMTNDPGAVFDKRNYKGKIEKRNIKTKDCR